MIVGLTGRNGAGKGRVSEWCVAHGLRYTSLSDELRAWLRAQGKEPTRDNLIVGGRALRSEGGSGILARLVLERIEREGGDWVVDSIRNPAEVDVLRTRPDFLFLEVVADVRTRFDRIIARNRGGDALDFGEFIRQESAELDSQDAAAQQLIATAAMADMVVRNDGTPEMLDHALAVLLPEIAGA